MIRKRATLKTFWGMSESRVDSERCLLKLQTPNPHMQYWQSSQKHPTSWPWSSNSWEKSGWRDYHVGAVLLLIDPRFTLMHASCNNSVQADIATPEQSWWTPANINHSAFRIQIFNDELGIFWFLTPNHLFLETKFQPNTSKLNPSYEPEHAMLLLQLFHSSFRNCVLIER